MKPSPSKSRHEGGYALISILVIGLTAALALLAVLDLALNAYQSEAQRRYSIELRNAAEAGADYAIGQLNSAAALHQPCSIDDGVGHQLLSGFLLASGGSPVINNQGALNNLTVTVTIASINPSSTWSDLAGWSSIYSPSTDFTKSSSAIWKSPPTSNITVDSWRVLTVKAQYLSFSRCVRVVLQPRYDPAPLGSTVSPPNSSYFSNVLLGNQKLSFSPLGNLTVQPVIASGSGSGTTTVSPSATASTVNDPPSDQVFQYPLNLSTNSLANIGPNTDIKGNVQISSINSGNSATITMNPSTQNGIIEGTLTGNSTLTNVAPSVFSTPGSTIAETSNVYANADLYNPGTNPGANFSTPNIANRVGTNATFPVSNSANLSQVLLAPALNEPGASLPSGTTLSAGDYSVSGLDTSSFSSTMTVTGAVRLFVQDGAVTSDGSAVNIDTNQLSTATSNATNFQIWYSGNNPININLSNNKNFNGTVYAPNATVTTTGNGTFTGAIVANTAQINHQGTLNLRIDLSTTGGAGAGLSYNSDSKGSYLTGYKPVTWEEPQL